MESNKNINEGKNITLKRQYTEKYPAVTAGQHAAIRNKVLEAIADGNLTKEEVLKIVGEHSNDGARWFRRNQKYFQVSEEGGVSLSGFGKRLLDSIKVNEGRKFVSAAKKAKDNGDKEFEFNGKKFPVTIKEGRKFVAAAKDAKDKGDKEFEFNGKKFPVTIKEKKSTLVHESFAAFLAANEAASMLAEAFKSTKLQNLLSAPVTRWSSKAGDLAKRVYNATKVKLDQIGDEDIVEVSAAEALKLSGNKIMFWLSDVEKENPYTPDNGYNEWKTIPGGGFILGITDADGTFYANSWEKVSGGKSTASMKKMSGKPGNDAIGMDKRYRGYGASGVYNLKRLAEITDRVAILDLDILRTTYSTADLISARAAAKAGATAFKSDSEFKKANKERYNEILKSRAMELPLDKMVLDAIDKLSAQIKTGMEAGEVDRYGNIKIGENPRGSAASMSNAAQQMSRILDYFADYSRSLASAEQYAKEYPNSRTDSYYREQAAEKAKSITDLIKQIDDFSYVW